ncbi:class I SAM-dependent methyltransferase [Rubritalea marina]|uniref:class I SAM-dependent methyltransferase n=1 Tax=Rubritalea marina TaxID=361055 RepID=UPI0003803E6E|nr:class I SAM-dependent methyltransferase [Rubritalea marina]
MPLPFSNKYTQGDLQKLKALLAPQFAEAFPLPRKQLRVLNIACGRADETGILIENLLAHTELLEITGVDIRNREIGEAKQRWAKHPKANCQFFTQNASQLDHVRELDGPYDLILMRHQNFWNGAETWVKIYDAALHRLSESGILTITSYFDDEHRQAMQAITSLGGKLQHTLRNPKARPIADAPNKSVDRHIAIFRRTPISPDIIV